MENESVNTQKEILKLLTILVRRGMSDAVLIQEMHSVGFLPKRTSELLNTTANTVRVTLSKSRKKLGK